MCRFSSCSALLLITPLTLEPYLIILDQKEKKRAVQTSVPTLTDAGWTSNAVLQCCANILGCLKTNCLGRFANYHLFDLLNTNNSGWYSVVGNTSAFCAVGWGSIPRLGKHPTLYQ